MSIFNSLGSNYDFNFAVKSFFTKGNTSYNTKLKGFIEKKYSGEVILTYKGREALRLALGIINKPEDFVVGVCGFTCFVVCEAAYLEGYKVQFLDIEKDSLNFSFETLKKAVEKNPKLKIVFIQNTLGYPCDIVRISKFCKEKGIILVEDLAHSIGTKYRNGAEAGTVGDFVMLSFSQDKVIDNVSGGALIVRNSKFKVQSLEIKNIRIRQQLKDSLYPLFAFKIRKTYGVGLGKFLHIILKQLNVLSNPMSYLGMGDIHSLPEKYSEQIYNQFITLENIIVHRKIVAQQYAKVLNKNVLLKTITEDIDNSSNLRFPILVNSREDLILYLKKFGIFISDIWYDSPIAPKRYLNKTNYKKGDCPNSEYVSERIVNLPTHRNVSNKDTRIIAEKVNEWLIKK